MADSGWPSRCRWHEGVARVTTVLVLVVGLGWLPPALRAGTCTVPGTHPTIQEAVLDPSCTAIDITATTYSESVQITRSLSINGPGGGGAVIEGLALVSGSSTQVSLSNLTVQNGCLPDGVLVEDGAELSGVNFTAISDSALPCPEGPTAVFGDDFDSGNTSAWSVTVP